MTCGCSRREFLGLSLQGLVAAIVSGSAPVALRGQDAPVRRRATSCILLWMDGGPSHLETFDVKPGTSQVKAIDTAADGVRISELLPRLAGQAKHLAVLRSVQSDEGSHWRAQYQAHTGYRPEEHVTVQHPSWGSIVCAEMWSEERLLPGYIAVGGHGFGGGLLGQKYNPFMIQDPDRAVEELGLRADAGRHASRERLRSEQAREFENSRGGDGPAKHRGIYEKAAELVRSGDLAAKLDMSNEKPYGDSRFARACLLARKFVELGVPFVEVSLPGWDTHSGNLPRTRALCAALDPAFAGLVADLAARGLLERTLVVWMGEFGRTPQINQAAGRDHHPRAWSAVLAGGGVRGGQAIGSTDERGAEVRDRPIPIRDLFASMGHAFGIDLARIHTTSDGRKVPIVPGGARPIGELF